MATWQNTSLIMLRTMLNDAGCDTVRYTASKIGRLVDYISIFITFRG